MKYAIVTPDNKIAAFHHKEADDRFILPGDGWRLIPEDEAKDLEDAPPQPETKGFAIEPEGLRLKDDDQSITLFANYLTGLVLAAQTPDDADVTFYDFFDKPQVLKMQRWREVMAGYFGHVTAKKGLS